MRVKSLLIASALSSSLLITPASIAQEVTKDHIGTTQSWLEQGEKAIADRLAQKPNTNRAKNVILFVGDGMGISTLTAGRILEGQLNGQPGEENYLSFERFPNTALVKTYNVNAQVADSAGTASALNTGTKTEIGVINTAPNHPNGICKGMEKDAPKTLAYLAEQAGMSTGIVSTARLTHATPAAVFAISPSRGWENDTELTEEAIQNKCTDIASQITTDLDGNGLEVALGGGARNFLPSSEGGKREDGRNIVTEWQNKFEKSAYVTNRAELQATDISGTDHLFGLFSSSHMSFTLEEAQDEPTLAEMTETAIKMLSKNDNGYYLMIEAGRIDHGHHGGNANAALNDTVALSSAVKKALELVDTEETLILVTADHSHTFTMAGYPKRGNPILGLVSGPGQEDGEYTMAKDGKPYTTVGYQNGPGAIEGERAHLTNEDTHHPEFQQQAAIPLWSETHGGEDVALFGIGPWSHLVKGTMEQNVVFHIMNHALGLKDRTQN
ncbi:alkaline phosphatase [Kordiimonas laminariae]|uniref:alkaline phosphatase n=1 Tax=Kordiimonas laminariae TaxID=2917717 RepID=UPI001FF62983|nr:alkaline phosphatase [Kordiimonas laminariae]MCK0070503.1 alkaline phosphatase [Kordiimonas laminariae]